MFYCKNRDERYLVFVYEVIVNVRQRNVGARLPLLNPRSFTLYLKMETITKTHIRISLEDSRDFNEGDGHFTPVTRTFINEVTCQMIYTKKNFSVITLPTLIQRVN